MLLRNKEQYKLSAADIQKIKAEFKKFPVMLTYPSSRIRKSLDPHNKLPDKPNSISFPLRALKKTEKGTEEWIYCEGERFDIKGQKVYYPATFGFKGKFILTENDMELIWWLKNCCPVYEGGENNTGHVAKCVIENRIALAAKKVSAKRDRNKFEVMLYDENVGLPESKLRELAKALHISSVDELTHDEVIIAIETSVTHQKDGVQKFLDLCNAEQVMKTRMLLQQAVDDGVILYIKNKRPFRWVWVTEQGQKNIPTDIEVRAGQDENEALYEYYIANVKFARELVSAMKGESYISQNVEVDEE